MSHDLDTIRGFLTTVWGSKDFKVKGKRRATYEVYVAFLVNSEIEELYPQFEIKSINQSDDSNLPISVKLYYKGPSGDM